MNTINFKKLIYITAVFVFGVCFFNGLCGGIKTIKAATYDVCASGCSYTTVQSAIDAVSAGSTIYVKNGTYTEQITVNKQVILEGESNIDTHIVGGFKVTADNVTIKNFDITGGYAWDPDGAGNNGEYKAGIYVESSGNTITSNKVSNIIGGGATGTDGGGRTIGSGGVAYGIYLISSSTNIITSNAITYITGGGGGYGGDGGSAIGIYLTALSTGNTLESNTISNITGITPWLTYNTGGVGSGIYLESSSTNTITSNTISDVRSGGYGGVGAGIYIASSSIGNMLKSDTISRITGANGSIGAGIYLTSTTNTIISNIITDIIGGGGRTDYYSGNVGAGIYLGSSSSSNTITSNTISDAEGGQSGYRAMGGVGSGIYLESSSTNTITSNTISDMTGGYGSTGIGVGAGIYLLSSNSNNIISNSTSIADSGIYLTSSSTNAITSNTIYSTIYGIYLTSSSTNAITSNTIYSIAYGIYLTSSTTENTLELNAMSSLSGAAIAVDESSYDNTITPLSGNIPDGSKLNTVEGQVILYFYNKTNINVSNFDIDTSALPILIIGKVSTGLALINVSNSVISNNTISGLKGVGGITVSGIYLMSSSTENTLESNNISYITGSNGGDPGYYETGGAAIGIYLTSPSTLNTIISNNIFYIIGGNAGRYAAGGAGTGIYFMSSSFNNIISNNISNITGGNGRYGAGKYVPASTGGAGTGIYLMSSSTENTVELNDISYITGGNGGHGGNGGAGAGIYLMSSSTENTVELNDMSYITGGNGALYYTAGGTGVGIYLLSSENTITSNDISGITGGTSGTQTAGSISAGIYLLSSNSNTLTLNEISSAIYGIYFMSSSTENILELNAMSSLSGAAIAVDESSYDNIITPLSGNIPDDSKLNTVEGQVILYFYNKTNINVSNFDVNTSTAPILIVGKTSTGLALINVSNSVISNGNISNITGGNGGHYYTVGAAAAGIYLLSSLENTIILNNISGITGGEGGPHVVGGAGVGIYFESSNFNDVTLSNISNITGGEGGYHGYHRVASGTSAGVHLELSSENTTTSNEIYSAIYGFYFTSSSTNTIISNNISNTTYGIHFDLSSTNTTTSNKIYSNTYGFYLNSTSDCLIYNNLVDAPNNVLFTGDIYENKWNVAIQPGTNICSNWTQIGGNCWTRVDGSGYSNTCVDADANGFCDEQYNLTDDGKNTDYFPVVNDIVSPVLTVLGSNPVNIDVENSYTDAGATALDNIDGNITANISIVNPVNTSIAGTYTITYNVSDFAGNPAIEKTRIVNIIPDITSPFIILEAKDVNDILISNTGTVDKDLTYIVTIESVASDDSGIQDHKIHFTNDNWVSIETENCNDRTTCVVDICSIYSCPLDVGIEIKYKAEATDIYINTKIIKREFIVNDFNSSDWNNRCEVTIDNTNPDTLTEFQVSFALNTQTLITADLMQPDCRDLRVTDSDGTTLLPYWIESGCNTTETVIWTRVPIILGFSNKTIFAYYGNETAVSESSLWYNVEHLGIDDGVFDYMGGEEGIGVNGYHSRAMQHRLGISATICNSYALLYNRSIVPSHSTLGMHGSYAGNDVIDHNVGLFFVTFINADGNVFILNNDGEYIEEYSGGDAVALDSAIGLINILKNDGNVMEAWRDPDSGILNNPFAEVYSGGDAIAVSASSGGDTSPFISTCVLRNNGNVACNIGGTVSDIYTGGDAIQITTDSYCMDNFCILRDDGNVLCDRKITDGSEDFIELYAEGDAIAVYTDYYAINGAPRDNIAILRKDGYLFVSRTDKYGEVTEQIYGSGDVMGATIGFSGMIGIGPSEYLKANGEHRVFRGSCGSYVYTEDIYVPFRKYAYPNPEPTITITCPSINTPPIVTSASISINYCKISINNLALSWTFDDAEDGNNQTAFQIKLIRSDTAECDSEKQTSSWKIITANEINTGIIDFPGCPDFIDYNYTYTWQVTVWDSNDAISDTVSGTSFTTPLHKYPIANFVYDAESPVPLLQPITFDPSSSEVCEECTVVLYEWYFDNDEVIDKTTSPESPNAVYSYTKEGTFTVDLEVTDSGGYTCKASDRKNDKTITIGERRMPIWTEVAP